MENPATLPLRDLSPASPVGAQTPRNAVIEGDCLAILRTLPDNSVDSLVTDPPAGVSFMGATWDHNRGGRDAWVAWMTEIMAECFRVMKPGAHGVVWSLPRTSHWTAWALEDAGLEIRDAIDHVFASGFPKSHNVSKAIDKAAGAEREVIGTETLSNDIRGNSSNGKGISGPNKSSGPLVRNVTAPSTDAAKQWEGWGTALKPAHETWWLVRKPIVGTIADNVLTFGTGALNIDATRIVGAKGETWGGGEHATRIYGSDGHYEPGPNAFVASEVGRFPPNLILSAPLFDDPDSPDVVGGGNQRSGGNPSRRNVGEDDRNAYGGGWVSGETGKEPVDTVGGKSRFFQLPDDNSVDSYPRYLMIPKASRKERNEGLGELTNDHPTVKSRELMKWLCRLVGGQPGSLVLDPFGGSGSTALAAVDVGLDYLLIEKDPHFAQIARARLRVGGIAPGVNTVESCAPPAEEGQVAA